jgi:hypothetical protein
MKRLLFVLFAISILGTSCNENYSNGERIGLVTQFSKTGNFFKSWEGHLNVTQTGMNSSVPFDFSVDNDDEPEGIAKTLDSAATLGWKVKIKYHETFGKNWFNNRGNTDHFVTSVDVLDKTPVQNALGIRGDSAHAGKIIDTIFVMIVDKSKIKQ